MSTQPPESADASASSSAGREHGNVGQPPPVTGARGPALLEQADELAAQGDYESAAAVYRQLVGNRDPQLHVAALLGLAESRYRLDDEESALQLWIVATQAPDTPLSWIAWKQIAAFRVRQGDLVGALRAYREADSRAPREERAEIASRLGWLNKELGNARAARRNFGRSRAGGVSQPVMTYLIIGITVAIGLMQILTVDDFWTPLLALDKERVAQGEFYRLVSVVLVHGNALHLALNMYALYLVGPIVEGLYGRALYVGSYVLCAVGGSTLSYVLLPNPAVGASGAIFGLFGMLLIGDRVYRPALGRQARALASQVGTLIVLNLVLGFGLAGGGVGIDNYAHIGGLLAGGWLGLVIPPRGAATLGSFWHNVRGATGRGPRNGVASGASPLVLQAAAVVLLVAVLALGVALGTRARLGPATGVVHLDPAPAIMLTRAVSAAG